MSLLDHQTLVDSLVRDSGGSIAPLERDRAIGVAVARYSQDVRRGLSADVTWPDGGTVGPVPAEWADADELALVDAESPPGQQPRASLAVGVQLDGGGNASLCVDRALEPGAVLRVRYTAAHQLDDQVDTIAARHSYAVAAFAASVLCLQLAVLYAGERESSIGADGSNTESRSRNYRSVARDYRAAYYSGIGQVDPEKAPAASASSGTKPAASIGSWPSRRRYGFRSNDTGYGR